MTTVRPGDIMRAEPAREPRTASLPAHSAVLPPMLRHRGRSYKTLGFSSYDAYLRSPHWEQVKANFRASDRDQDCYCCGSSDDIHLHHKTYARLGREQLDDLVPLCRRCHTLVHVLERRGDLPINLAGLLDAARAKRYAAEHAVTPVAAARDRDDAIRRQRAKAARMANQGRVVGTAPR